ncbi:hypothetical protein SAMN05192574_1011027 [Mucilaginibacter gossypiicola]|uniref:Uncharacterized protein n=1 Tax=Mucilaginibacter gossypiicola TaxID=551995 RepID=A0A1H8BSQ5_9SPHI|nr:hypothetical protein [Mucilaginibacter gossypiicola]SEM85806.1 hypothetical protein SAMN05192574_1011027 [Mucilaginibacter gossypiicola]
MEHTNQPSIVEFLGSCQLLPNISIIRLKINMVISTVIFRSYDEISGVLYFNFVTGTDQISVGVNEIKSIETIRGDWHRNN